jgi:integral membrane sensor domain MASE1
VTWDPAQPDRSDPAWVLHRIPRESRPGVRRLHLPIRLILGGAIGVLLALAVAAVLLLP